MTGQTEVQIDGLAELDQLLKTFAPRIEANIVRGALRSAQKVILDEAKRRVPKDDGHLAASLRVSSKINKKRGRVITNIVAGNAKAFYAHMVEYGTGAFYQGNGESVRGAYVIKAARKKSLFFGTAARKEVLHPGAKPQPFMRPAFDTKQAESLDQFRKYMRQRIEKEFAKRGAK